MAKACPHCNQSPAPEAYPFCSWCKLFLVELEELDLSPTGDLATWRKDGKPLTWLN